MRTCLTITSLEIVTIYFFLRNTMMKPERQCFVSEMSTSGNIVRDCSDCHDKSDAGSCECLRRPGYYISRIWFSVIRAEVSASTAVTLVMYL